VRFQHDRVFGHNAIGTAGAAIEMQTIIASVPTLPASPRQTVLTLSHRGQCSSSRLRGGQQIRYIDLQVGMQCPADVLCFSA
jgi:hypothetical protein